MTEDDPIAALDLRRRLQKLGHQVVAVVSSGEASLEQARRLRPDLVMMDIQLEGPWDGIQTAEQIREELDLPVVFLTANDENSDFHRAQRSEPFNYLLKPFRERELHVAVEVALRHHAMQRVLREANDHLEERVRQRTAELAEANRALQAEVSERQRAEAAASEWNKRYDLVVGSAGRAVYDLDLRTGAVVWGEGAERLLGHPLEELGRTRKQWLGRIHPLDQIPTLEQLENTPRDSDRFDLHYRFKHGDGHYVWMHDSGLFVRDAVGKVLRMLGMMEDVTTRKTAEEKIQQQATLLERTQDAIMVRNLEGRIEFWNRSAERLYGWTREEAHGRMVRELLKTSGGRDRSLKAQLTTLQTGEWSGEIQALTKDGRELTVQSRWTLLRGNAGQPTAFLVTHTDLTEKKLLEAKFLRAQRLESIGALAGGVAHDLNNVFTPILVSAQMLDGRVAAPEDQNMLALLQNSARRGAEMVKQILTFARGTTASDGVVQIKHLVRDIERMARETFPRQIQVRTNLPRDLWSARGDATQFHQVLMNLCINARDAMPQGGILKMEAANFQASGSTSCGAATVPAGSYLELTVSDTGTGMPPEVCQRIFEPFFTTKDPGKGTGLGLSTVLSIVQAHGGFLDVRSEVGVGTRFQILLPADRLAQDAVAQPKLEPPPHGNGETILVVDDESVIREIVKTTLEAHGYEVLLAGEGAEAIALYAANRGNVALVITDMVMPFMDGAATIRALRKLDPKVRLLTVSGAVDQQKASRMADDDQIPFLPKPYSSHSLLTTIHRLISAPAN